jgi:hypothetical protein
VRPHRQEPPCREQSSATQALGVIHILVSGGRPNTAVGTTGHCVPTVLASACVGPLITRHDSQADCVIEFAINNGVVEMEMCKQQ